MRRLAAVEPWTECDAAETETIWPPQMRSKFTSMKTTTRTELLRTCLKTSLDLSMRPRRCVDLVLSHAVRPSTGLASAVCKNLHWVWVTDPNRCPLNFTVSFITRVRIRVRFSFCCCWWSDYHRGYEMTFSGQTLYFCNCWMTVWTEHKEKY